MGVDDGSANDCGCMVYGSFCYGSMLSVLLLIFVCRLVVPHPIVVGVGPMGILQWQPAYACVKCAPLMCTCLGACVPCVMLGYMCIYMHLCISAGVCECLCLCIHIYMYIIYVLT